MKGARCSYPRRANWPLQIADMTPPNTSERSWARSRSRARLALPASRACERQLRGARSDQEADHRTADEATQQVNHDSRSWTHCESDRGERGCGSGARCRGQGDSSLEAGSVKARCTGPEPHRHVNGCRVGRPKCRWRRRPTMCWCCAYHYPHRDGGGRCNPRIMDLFVNGPLPSEHTS